MKGYKHLTAEENQAILDTYGRLGHVRLVQKELGHSYSKIRNALERAGVPRSGGRVGACYQNREAIEAMAREGASLTKIAEKIGTNKKTVRRFLARFQIERKPHVQVGQNNPAWRGGRMTDKAGYVLIHQPDHPHATKHGYVREHRLVMEKKIGRHLLPSEVVHHDPKVAKSDNQPQNLYLYDSNAAHLREELTGKCPKWTAAGRSKLQALFSNRDAKGRLLPMRRASGPCDPA